MKCPSCQAEVNPTLVYCSTCGQPIEADITDVLADEERRREETRLLQSVRDAKGLLITGLFTLGAVIALRVLFLDDRTYDETPAFRAPYVLVEEAPLDPPTALTLEPLVIPLPTDEE